MEIRSVETLRELFGSPHERALRKQIAALDVHCRKFISLSPMLILSSCDAEHNLDASPRGGAPGFVKVSDDGTVLIPDAPGNNRLDSLQNILATRKAGLLFLIPGFDETLRVNGEASLSISADDIRLCTSERRAPKLVIRVEVTAAYLHCAKALLRSKLWAQTGRADRSELPTIGQMIAEQSGLQLPAETREEMEKRYAPDL